MNFAKRHNKNAGLGIKVDRLESILKTKKISNFRLIKGDVTKTVPNFIKKNKNLKIALLHLDLDVYVPTKILLENFFPFVEKNGIILIDDYKHVSGATRAVNEFLRKNRKLKIEKLKFPSRPSFIVKK